MIFFISKIVKRIDQLSKVKRPLFALIFLTFFSIQCSLLPSTKKPEPARMVSSTPNNELSQNHAPYEYCANEKKMYLEDQILQMPIEYRQDHTDQWQSAIPIRCVQFAQKNFNGHFAKCENEDSKPVATQFRPCLTQNYSYLVYNAYHDVMNCFNLDPKEFYLQVMVESGFHPNAFNRTGFDSGLTQFTANGIKRVVTNNRIERTRRILLESSSPSCQRIASTVGAFDITAFVVEKRCSMISLPKNPYRAMLFYYLHTILDQIDISQQIENEISDLHEIQPSLTPKIKRQLVFLAYNRGMTGLRRVLAGYVENRKKMDQIPTEDDLDLNQNLSRAMEILRLNPKKRDLLKRARIKKLSFAEYAVIQNVTYVAHIVGAQDYVRRHLGDECSRF